MKAKYPDSDIKLIEGSGGIFKVTYNGRVIYSKHNIKGQRFPNEGEIAGLIEQETG